MEPLGGTKYAVVRSGALSGILAHVSAPWPKEKLTFPTPIWGQTCVYLDRIPYRDLRGQERIITLVDFDRDGVMAEGLRLLRGTIIPDATAPSVTDPEKARLLGRLLYSELHPDIGTGHVSSRYASLGRRKLNMVSFMKWLRSEEGSRQDARFETYQQSPPSFRAWKAMFNCQFPDARPPMESYPTADKFLDSCGIELALQEARLCWGRPKKGKWPKTPDGTVPKTYYKNMRIKLGTLLGQAGHDAGGPVDHAATLLSYADAVAFLDQVARDILKAIPEDKLGDLDLKAFAVMWLAEPGQDERGLFDAPLVALHAPSGLLGLWLDEHEKTPPSQRSRVCQLLDFIETGQHNPAITEALRMAWLYPDWLNAVRRYDRERRRPPS